jgi:simple sugar transport system permease protein
VKSSQKSKSAGLVSLLKRTPWVPIVAVIVALLIFIAFAASQGAGLDKLYAALYYGVLANPNFLTQTLTKSVPIICAALAVCLPARAGLVNVGGEGQLIMGAVAGTGVAVQLGAHHLGLFAIIMSLLCGALAGGVWGYLCAVLKTALKAPEAVTTLLANFIATDFMLFLLYSSWKDPNGSGQPQSKPLAANVLIGSLPGIAVPITFLVVLLAIVAVQLLFVKTSWGFAAHVVGQNPAAAFRSGLSPKKYAQSAMFMGGALAGLGGALNILGAEAQLRPGITTTFGFIAFLAAFVARGNVIKTAIYAFFSAAILVASNPLQLRAGLDGNAAYVLLGVSCLAIVVMSKKISVTSRRSQ